MKKIIKNTTSLVNKPQMLQYRWLVQPLISRFTILTISLLLVCLLAACGSHPILKRDQKDQQADLNANQQADLNANQQADLNANQQTETSAQEQSDAQKAKISILKAQCIAQQIDQISFTSVLEDTQKYVLQFIQFYEMVSKNDSDLNMVLQRSQYLIQFNQSLFKYLSVIEIFSQKCDPAVFDFIAYRKQLTDYIDSVIKKYK